MSPRTTRAAIVTCALVLCSAATAVPQTRLKGIVHTPGNDPFVAREQVAIEGADKYKTDDHGEFEFDLVGDLKVGQPARFHVYHVNPAIQIQQWVVFYPCDLKNGRKDSLPAIGPEPISILVLPKGDPRLKSLNKDYSILGCTIEEVASEFKPVSRSGKANRGSLFNGGSSMIADGGQSQARYKSPVSRSTSFPRVVEAAYRVPAQDKPSASSLRDVGNSTLLDQAFLTRRAEELGLTPQELVDALNVWARSVEGRYEKGLAALYERRYAEASENISASIPSPPGEFLKRYVPLARAEYEQGHYSAAEAALRKVLAVHTEDPLILNNLGVVLGAEAKYAEAEPLLKRALAISEKALEPDHPTVAIRLNSLAELYRKQGKYAEAEPLYKRALAISEKALGPDHPTVATNLNNLAALYESQGKYAEAESLLRRALTIDEKALGPDHPQVATNLNNLAALYRTQGKDAEAETLYKRALAINEKALGSNHPQVATSLNNLAALYRTQGKYAEAETLYKQALTIDEKTLGPDHPDVATDLNNLGSLYDSQGKYAEAERLLKRALAISEKALGPNHPDVATELNNLGSLYDSQGKYAEAETLYKHALTIDEKALGPDHPDVATDLNNLGSLYDSQGKYAEAEPLLKRALAISEKALGPDHADVAMVAETLAADLRKLGRDAEAKAYEEQAAKIRAKNQR